MKKALILSLGLIMGLALNAAEGNLLANGGFEKIKKSTKSSDKYLLKKIKEGWNFGTGPLAILPTDWVPNIGAAKLEVMKKANDAANVHSGEYALKITAIKGAHIYTKGSKAGAYDISYWAKGNGKIMIVAYCYCTDKKTRTYVLLNNKVAGDEWKEFKKTVDLAKACPQAASFALAIAVAKDSVVIIDDMSLTPAATPESK